MLEKATEKVNEFHKYMKLVSLLTVLNSITREWQGRNEYISTQKHSSSSILMDVYQIPRYKTTTLPEQLLVMNKSWVLSYLSIQHQYCRQKGKLVSDEIPRNWVISRINQDEEPSAFTSKTCQHLPERNHLLLLRNQFENVILFQDKFGFIFKPLKANWLTYS